MNCFQENNMDVLFSNFISLDISNNIISSDIFKLPNMYNCTIQLPVCSKDTPFFESKKRLFRNQYLTTKTQIGIFGPFATKEQAANAYLQVIINCHLCKINKHISSELIMIIPNHITLINNKNIPIHSKNQWLSILNTKIDNI